MNQPKQFEKDGLWRCLRCEGQHAMVGPDPCHRIMVGQQLIAFCCAGCLDVVKREILALVPEPSFHGSGHVD
jgi:hypothetical protein